MQAIKTDILQEVSSCPRFLDIPQITEFLDLKYHIFPSLFIFQTSNLLLVCALVDYCSYLKTAVILGYIKKLKIDIMYLYLFHRS